MNQSDCWRTAFSFIEKGDREKAIALCETELCATSIDCQRFLGWEYYNKREMTTALGWFKKAAEQGDVSALLGVAFVHFVEKEFPLARQYFERAADAGSTRAIVWIGVSHHQGWGVPRNLELAKVYYKKAASHGDFAAERALIHLALRHGSWRDKILAVARILPMAVRVGKIAGGNPVDPRILDICSVLSQIRSSGGASMHRLG